MTIIRHESSSDMLVQFQDEHAAIVHTTYSNFLNGHVKNPYDISVFGVGYLGEGVYMSKISGKSTPEYLMWMSMLQRCYSEKWKFKFPAYYGICSVCNEWLNFQNFAKWYHSHYYETSERLHLDKDILIPGNTLYSPDTCVLVPQRINMLFTGRNKADIMDIRYAEHIRHIADEYRNIIPMYVYDALIRRTLCANKHQNDK